MAFGPFNTFILAFVVLCCVVFAKGNNNVPVFLWGNIEGIAQKSNPLQRLSNEEFDTILRKELEDKYLVAFIEESLSVEDFKIKNDDGLSAYNYLHSQLDNSLYLPSVASPMDTLNDLEDFKDADNVRLNEKTLVANVKTNGNGLFITLEDAKTGESRFDMLKRHDQFMSELVNKLSEKRQNVVAIYTARFPSWMIPESEIHHRSKRDVGDLSAITTANVLLVATGGKYTQNGVLTDLGTVSSATQGTKNDTYIGLDITFTSGTAKLSITKEADYWFISEVIYNGETLKNSYAFARDEFSYSCNDELEFTSLNGTFSFNGTFQIQPFFNSSAAEKFGEAFYCTGFFSVPIWSGLLIVALLLIITFSGTCMMMDIRTNDRYDDPKGKTITINAAE